MDQEAKIRSFQVPPPGGEFFCIINGERVSDKYWLRLRPKVVQLMAKHGIVGVPEKIVAESMCPYMPDWFCEGVCGHTVVRVNEAKSVAKEYFERALVTFDRISDRLQVCSGCPKHDRSMCLTCTGLLQWILVSFGNRRISVPEDKMTGTCECARTFTAVAASVEYGKDEPLWEGTPDNCWRKTK